MLNTTEILGKQLGGNILYIIISIVGLIANSLVIVIYTKYSASFIRQAQSYRLLRSLAVADTLACLGFLIWGSFRVHRYALHTNAPVGVSSLSCSSWLIEIGQGFQLMECRLMALLAGVGFETSISLNFVAAIDRFVFLCWPKFHRKRLGSGFIFFLIFLGWVRVPIEVPLYLVGGSDSIRTQVCSAYSPELTNTSIRGNVVAVIANEVDLALVGSSILVYVLAYFLGRRNLKRFLLNAIGGDSAETREILQSIKAYLHAQRQIFRVTFLVAVKLIFTALVSTIAYRAVLSEGTDKHVGLSSYMGCFQILNSADTFFLSFWRDRTFRAKTLSFLKTLYRLPFRQETGQNTNGNPSNSVVVVRF